MKYILITFMHAVSTPDITTPQFVVWKKNESRNGIRFAKSKEDDVSISSKSLISIQAKIFNNFYLSWFVSSVRSHSLYQTCLMLSTEMTALVVCFFHSYISYLASSPHLNLAGEQGAVMQVDRSSTWESGDCFMAEQGHLCSENTVQANFSFAQFFQYWSTYRQTYQPTDTASYACNGITSD